jgi:resuscitation-promoting factor RpfB
MVGKAGFVALACAASFVAPANAQVGTEGPRASSSAERAGNPCRTRACVKRVRLKRWRRAWARTDAGWRAWAHGTAYCETGGTMSPTIHNPSGTYHGLGQFDLRTWGEAGGTGDPHHASYHEQLVRMVRLARRVGKGRWPHCGRR